MNEQLRRAPSPDLLPRFAAIVGDRYAITDPAALEPYLIEGRGIYHGRSSMLLRPGSAAEVQAILKLANETKTPLVPQGGNTGLVGGGVPDESVHTEIFGALESITPGMTQAAHTPHLPPGAPGSGPPVSFARSGITAAWDRKFASLLELAEACDVPVRWSCRTGVCHTCMTGLISGSIHYAPEPLEMSSAGNLLLCCSQPDANLVIAL